MLGVQATSVHYLVEVHLNNLMEESTRVENVRDENDNRSGSNVVLFWFVPEKQSATSFPCDEIPLQPQIKKC